MASQGQERNEFFQKLKPWCVKISQLAIREADAPASARDLRDPTNKVLTILNDQIQQNPVVLDEKLAEYVFFPLYHIFRQMDKYPMTLIETCIKCLTILIVHGWKSKLSPELSKQILTLLTFIIDGVPGEKNKREVPEEVVLESFRGLTALLSTAGTSATAASGFSNADAMPALGHSITVMLDSVVDGATPQIQQEALRTLQAVYTTLREHEALASFLPGTISSLAKVTSTATRYKNSVLAKCLETVQMVLIRVLADLRTRSILAKEEKGDAEESEKSQLLSPAWLRATVAQVKRALSNMMKLRAHESAAVKRSLSKLCVTLLDECHKTLENCTLILVETAIVLDGQNGIRSSLTETSLQDLVSIYPELGEKVKTTAYNWLSSFPRIMQAADEDVKQTAIHNLLKAFQLLRSLRIESSTLEYSLSGTLRDSVVALAQSSQTRSSDGSMEIQLIDDGASSLVRSQNLKHPPVLLSHESQKGVRGELMHLIQFLGSNSQQGGLSRSMLEQLQESTSINQVAAFWLCFQLVKAGHEASAETDAFLDLSSLTGPSDDLEAVFNELYSASVQILDAHGDGSAVDWRLEAIALEVAAYTAQKSGVSFRPELIDVLFPIATFLGSSNASLRAHAMVTLNSMAISCGYANVSELIIDNVDYMVNSVSLRLNTLDISPASINVLKMMIRLAGPRLVPYLDDVVESIFASLDNYHGYPFFVESLFAVLKEVVDQGVHSDMLLLGSQKALPIDHRKKPMRVDGMQGLLETLAKWKRREADEVIETKNWHPQTPWKADKGVAKANDEDAGGTTQGDQEKPPNTPTYQLLLRVADLTQHYLTSPTPTLRRSLLELLTTASTALAPDEESFLPLVNAIWPVVIERLRDSETYISIEACHALSALCSAAGDFLSSRFKTEWHDWLRNWCRRAKRQASSTARTRPHGEGRIGGGLEKDQILIPTRGEDGLVGKPSSHMPMSVHPSGLGQFASPVRIWEAVVELLTSVVSFVRVDEDMFDDILDLLSDVLDRNKKVREALEAINEDAVWLARYERGSVQWHPAPQMDGVRFVEMDKAK